MVGRRRFLEALAALGVSQAVPARAADRKISFDSYPFTLGVASGYPRPDGMVLWTRLIANLAGSLAGVTLPGVVERSIGHFARADAELGSRLTAAVAAVRERS